jgi:hypothetical protein
MPVMPLRVALLLFGIVGVSSLSAQPTEQQLQQWLESDDMAPPASRSSDEALQFIAPPTDKPAVHSINNITISEQSLTNGWVKLKQCYEQLDPVPDMEVSYQYKAMQQLRIVETRHIEQAWVEGDSVQMRNVAKHARLCIAAKVKIFYANPDGRYKLVNGPFHRQFLDSFFPYHLSMTVDYPASLQLTHTVPKAQPGFSVIQQAQRIEIDTHFTGKLYTEIYFKVVH